MLRINLLAKLLTKEECGLITASASSSMRELGSNLQSAGITKSHNEVRRCLPLGRNTVPLARSSVRMPSVFPAAYNRELVRAGRTIPANG